MAVWLVRAGKYGEHEGKFFADGKIYVAWHKLNFDLSPFSNRNELMAATEKAYPEEGINTVRNWTAQFNAFAFGMEW